MNDFATDLNTFAETGYMQESYKKQKNAYLSDPQVPYSDRAQDLLTLKKMLVDNRDALTEAISQDYGNRSWHETTFGEIIAVLGTIDYMRKRLKRWMKPQKRHVDHLLFPGARNTVVPQPVGVVGIIVPWNFPINLSMIPIATALSAGNRAMVKMSENSKNLTKLLMKISPRYFPENKLSFIKETGRIGVEFSKLPFNLLVFTGSTDTGKSVMSAAAKNLTPVILELGGKSPAIIDKKYSIEKAVQRIFYAKQFNAGQVCLNVDYVFVHEDKVQEFIDQAMISVKKYVPDINNADYSSVIDDRSVKRLEEILQDAEEKGAQIINLNEQPINFKNRKFPLHLVLNPTDDMMISQREIFGPILLVRTYKEQQQVIDFVNDHDRPLGLYVFSERKECREYYINRIMSGGVSVNDTMLHAFQDDLPFGGIGHSGMGQYHGHEGFVSFSKMRPIFHQPKINAMGLLSPPYPGWLTRVYKLLVKFKS